MKPQGDKPNLKYKSFSVSSCSVHERSQGSTNVRKQAPRICILMLPGKSRNSDFACNVKTPMARLISFRVVGLF